MGNIKDIISGCINGNKVNQKRLYNDFYPVVYKTSMRHSSSYEEGEDFIQEIFIKLFNNLNKFDGDSHGEFGGWAKKISKNHCIDYTRKRKLDIIKTISEEALNNLHEDSDSHVEPTYSLKEIIEAVNKLSPSYKKVFNLYFMDGYTHDEISEILSLNCGTSKSNLYKAKLRMRKLLVTSKLD